MPVLPMLCPFVCLLRTFASPLRRPNMPLQNMTPLNLIESRSKGQQSFYDRFLHPSRSIINLRRNIRQSRMRLVVSDDAREADKVIDLVLGWGRCRLLHQIRNCYALLLQGAERTGGEETSYGRGQEAGFSVTVLIILIRIQLIHLEMASQKKHVELSPCFFLCSFW